MIVVIEFACGYFIYLFYEEYDNEIREQEYTQHFKNLTCSECSLTTSVEINPNGIHISFFSMRKIIQKFLKYKLTKSNVIRRKQVIDASVVSHESSSLENINKSYCKRTYILNRYR